MAARLWLPEGAEDRPVPAILNTCRTAGATPPRRRRPMHRYFAGHGYACLRVDMRGTGDSEG